MVTLTTEELEGLTPDQRKAHLAAEEVTVFGQNFQRDHKGEPIEVGHGAKGHETGNHLAALRRWEGEESYQAAVTEIWKRDPERAKRLNLPQRRTAK